MQVQVQGQVQVQEVCYRLHMVAGFRATCLRAGLYVSGHSVQCSARASEAGICAVQVQMHHVEVGGHRVGA